MTYSKNWKAYMTDSDTELSDFTKLVLARLETNPDEFQLGGRWDTLVRGIEAFVRGDQEDRYYRTLWPLDDPEVRLITKAYRKAYLARLHKDMLKNIVSGDDLKVNDIRYSNSNDINPLKGGVLRGTSPNTITTPASIANSALGVLQKEFDKSYNDAFSNAIVKGEGQAVQMANTNTVTYKPTNRYVLNKTHMALAKKLGMTEDELVKYAHLVNININTGGSV